MKRGAFSQACGCIQEVFTLLSTSSAYSLLDFTWCWSLDHVSFYFWHCASALYTDTYILLRLTLLSFLFHSVRIGVIYLLSAITGSMVAALFLQDTPTVTSSGALFGLLGTMLSALFQNWKIYSRKVLCIFIRTGNCALFNLIWMLNF